MSDKVITPKLSENAGMQIKTDFIFVSKYTLSELFIR